MIRHGRQPDLAAAGDRTLRRAATGRCACSAVSDEVERGLRLRAQPRRTRADRRRSSARAISSPTTSTSWPTPSTRRCSTCAATTIAARTGTRRATACREPHRRPRHEHRRPAASPGCRGRATCASRPCATRSRRVAPGVRPHGHACAAQRPDDHRQPRAAARPGRHARGPLSPRLRRLPLAVPTRPSRALWMHGHTSLAAAPDWRVDWGRTTLINVTGAVLIEIAAPTARRGEHGSRSRHESGKRDAHPALHGQGRRRQDERRRGDGGAVRPARPAHARRLDRHRPQPGRRARHAGRARAAPDRAQPVGPRAGRLLQHLALLADDPVATSRASSRGAASTR